MKTINYMKRIRNMLLLIFGSIIAILVCILMLMGFHSRRDRENQIIIESFARQQLLTQIMSKDAGRIYSIYQAQDDYSDQASLDRLEERMKIARASILSASEEFQKNLDAMNMGELVNSQDTINIKSAIRTSSNGIKQLNQMWIKFDEAVKILAGSDTKKDDSLPALVYIQDHNTEMLALSEEISEQVMNATLRDERMDQVVLFSMMFVLIFTILISFKSLYTYIVVPYRQLYQGFGALGLTQTGSTLREGRNLDPLVSEVSDLFKKVSDLFKLIDNMNNNYNFTEMLNFINETFSDFISYNYIGVALIDKERQTVKATYGVSDGTIKGMPEDLMGKTFRLKDTSLEAVIEEGNARIINDLDAYTEGRPVKYYNKVIMESGIKSSITLPLKRGNDPIGVIFFSSSQKHVYRQEHIALLKMLANSIAVSFEQNIFIDDLIYSNTLALAKLAEARDEDTGEHLERMKVYSSKIAEYLYGDGLYPNTIDLEYIGQIERFSPLHDIGKVGVPDGILLKPGKLTHEEFEEMKKHTTYGAEVLRTAEKTISRHKRCLFGVGIEIAEGHQEWWNGSGYPFGRKGDEIPLSARIVAVADVLDALTSERPYKKAFSFEKSVQMMMEERGTHFDPVILDCFQAHIDEIYRIYKGFSAKKPDVN